MTAAVAPALLLPEVGQAVIIRNRLALVRTVEPYDTRDRTGRLNLVEVEYLDDFRHPLSDHVLWEMEPQKQIIGKTSLPGVDANRPDHPAALQAFVNAHRWTRLNRLRGSESVEEEPLLGVWNSAIQVHSYQLEPVLRALDMPRVSLMLADGVGLGKTIQAGLVLEELLLRRRIRRILVLCPAMLQRQWQLELRRKFSLEFQIVDSDSTFDMRRRLGIDTNPWKAHPRIITSMDYLRMPDVLQQFLQASGADAIPGSGRVAPHGPWDLLIVDEAHHFAPQSGGRASQRTRMLREIRFLFEHRIFASATPHNGKTVCFTGLLELLDPVRFQMTVEMSERDHRHLGEVRVRRLKDDINKVSLQPPFAEQLPPVELPLALNPKEAALYDALREYRHKGEAELASGSPSERWLGRFIHSLLTKRLLSCPYAFARTWWRHVEGGSGSVTGDLAVMARISAEKAEDEARNDEEKAAYEEDAARYGGAWLRARGKALAASQSKLAAALEAMGMGRNAIEGEAHLAALARKSDSKTDALVRWIKAHLFQNGALRDDERLIVFTEYKETLLYLTERLQQEGFDENTLRLLYGGMDTGDFEQVKNEFEDRDAPVRLLLATDAASEGINLQDWCRWIIHYDIPWSPSKILQRNGRVSRHGQVRDVSIHYFRCNQEEDLEFLCKVAQKVDQIRDDLGSVERVFSAAIESHFSGRKVRQSDLDLWVEQELAASQEKKDLGRNAEEDTRRLTERASRLLEVTDARLRISPEALVGLLETALRVEGGGALEPIPNRPGFYRLAPPPRWERLVRETLTVGPRTDRMELVFDSALVEEEHNHRRVLKLKKHQVLMRLSHPVMRQAMAALCRQLHDPASTEPIFRWTVAALHKPNFEALMAFFYTVTAVNDLREPLHDEVMTEVFRVEGDRLAPVERSFREMVLHADLLAVRSPERRDKLWQTFRLRWPRHREALERFQKAQEKGWMADLQKRADAACKRETDSAAQSYDSRLRELAERTREREMRRLAESLLSAKAATMQAAIFPELQEDKKAGLQALEEQIGILSRDVELTRALLLRERDYRLKQLLPARFALREVRVLPLAVEYIVPAMPEDTRL